MDQDRELLLLGILRQQEMHGYQLNEFIDSNLATCTDLKKSTAYYLLEKMASAGWVTFELVQEGNRPHRRVYRLTPVGEETFQALLRENLAGHTPVRFPGDAGLAFISALPLAERLELLRQRQGLIQAELEAVTQVPAHSGGIQLILDHRRHHLTAESRWLDEVIAAAGQSTAQDRQS